MANMRMRGAVCLMAAWVTTAAGAEIRFNRDVRPILSAKCFQCHGPDKNTRMVDLRLDVRAAAVGRGAITPGDPQTSELVERIYTDKKALQMPPVYSNKSLSDKEKDILKQWISEGAEYEPHWAYIPPERPDAPTGPAAIDHFIERRLAERGLHPVGEADRRTLIRRLSFDLTGLPPSPEEVRAFEQDRDPAAYETLVDRLLASPHYGERMAVHWLDLVRYADSVGFHSDVEISVWPYRDYVIRAFNENKPFDQLTREQLGGDLMPNPSQEQLIASAYNRLNRMTNEGGAQELEYRVRYAADRVRTTATVWLGSTLGCAECHDHKFDPFHQKDFYQMAAFFADIEEQGVYDGRGYWGPRVRVPPRGQEDELARINRELEQVRQANGAPGTEEIQRFEEAAASWQTLKARRVKTDSKLRYKRLSDGSYLARGKEPNKDLHQIDLKLDPGRVTALRLEAMGGIDGPYLLSAFSAELVRKEQAESLAIRLAFADYEDAVYRAIDTLDEEEQTAWGGEGTRQIAFVFDQPIEAERGDLLRLRLEYAAQERKTVVDRFRLSSTGAELPELPGVDFPGEAARKLQRRRAAILVDGSDCLVAHATEPRVVRILARGNWMDDTGEVVEPQVPHFLDPLPVNGRRLTRFDLANWLLARDNPLTARVFVNRLWRMYFGTGLSKVLDDVGSQGEPPVFPDLLDWLAVEFVESGWDVKHMVRTIVLSDTYRRSSEPSPELEQADPYNRLLGRQSMLRLDAEFVRDNALAVSGLLNRSMGGPSAKPYQPVGYYRELNFPKREYKPDHNENQWRRGVYTHWQRTFLHPSLMAFDAPSREECTADRSVSNTPLQSLALLNDPTYVEAARGFAARIIASGEASDEARLDWAFWKAFSRGATAEEKATLEEFLARERQRFEEDRRAAAQLITVGIAERPDEIEERELAAWTSVARALINKHEFLVRY